MLLAVIADIFQLKALWKQEVELSGGKCLFLAESCFDLYIELRTVEGSFALRFEEWKLQLLDNLTKHALGHFPHFVVLEILLRILRITV
ncbi:hypothetical protein D3C78_848250 [compost metagenome]